MPSTSDGAAMDMNGVVRTKEKQFTSEKIPPGHQLEHGLFIICPVGGGAKFAIVLSGLGHVTRVLEVNGRRGGVRV